MNTDEDLARDSATALEVVLRLCRSNSARVRFYCAIRADVPESMLAEMSCDIHLGVRSMVAFNTKAPFDVLRGLAVDPQGRVRMCVAKNQRTPSDLLVDLAMDSDKEAMFVLVGGPGIALSILSNSALPIPPYRGGILGIWWEF